ncbi:MAG: LLM class flavin-dependent oxidoreductase [Deltaproteobacteria bacterium]|nr:LLM class flavin-dependent oxidoreductase [Deltaproteobacteria bacterium]
MDFGICVPSKIDDVGYIARAENLGYSHAWVADSQMIWSDCYAVLALAAQQTRTIKIGTGVSVAGTRIAPVTASSIATINRLAPGRTFLGIGTGNTAMRIMGHKPLKLKEFGSYLRTLRGLLHGEEVELTWRGETTPVRFLMKEQKFIDTEHPIPLYISGFGPKAQGLAGEYGEGLVMSIPPDPGFMYRALNNAQAGASRANKTLTKDNFYTASLTTAVILEPGEKLNSERVLRECGAFVIASLHYVYDKIRQFGGDPPGHLRAMWEEYRAMVEKTPASHIHLRIHDGHCTYLLPEEAKFVTPELIKTTCLVGTPDEILEQIRRLEEAGLHQIMILPSLETQYRVIEDFAEKVMAKL